MNPESNQQKVEAQPIPAAKKRKDMSSAERVQLYQRKLYQKAKQERSFRFYVLYDKILLDYVLTESWQRVRECWESRGRWDHF